MFGFGRLKKQMSRRKVRDDTKQLDTKSDPLPDMKSSIPAKRHPNGYAEAPVPSKQPYSVETAKSTLSQQIERSASDPAYNERRVSLLAKEEERAWYHDAKITASPNEVRAQDIVFVIREHERLKLFGNLPSEKVPSAETLDLGGRFLVNKPRIDESKIFNIASRMPKGAHLHEHFNSEIMPEVLLPLIEDFVKDTMFVQTTRPLLNSKPTPNGGNDFEMAEIIFCVMPKDTPTSNIFSPDYHVDPNNPKKNGWMLWADFQDEFHKRLPNGVPTEDTGTADLHHLNNAQKWARERMVITLARAYHERQTHNGAWACFNQGTRAFKGLVNYESIYRWYIGAAIDSMIHDGIMYAELRPMLLDKGIPTDDGLRSLSHKDQMQIICEQVAAKQKALKEKNQLDDFPFGLKIIYSTPRSIPRQKMESELADCIQLKLQFPELICGFDLVGAEDRPNCISFYADMLVGFTQTCEQLGISIPFMFHAGETLLDTGGSHHPSKSNLYDSLLLNAKRIGHGYALMKHPMLVEMYKKQNICLELCPISNELLHLCGNVRNHPYPALLAAGLHCTLNSDNPSLFSSSLSHEFYQVMVGDTRMTVHGWKQLALWSIEHSCLEDKPREGEKESKRAQAEAIFRRKWEAWCAMVVSEYGKTAEEMALELPS